MNLLSVVLGFFFLGLLLGKRIGQGAAEAKEQKTIDALKQAHAEQSQRLRGEYEQLGARYEYLGQRYLSAVKRVRRQRQREWRAGRN